MGKFDINSLNNFVAENNFELIGEYEKINRESIIKGKCKTLNCCNEFSKVFRTLYVNKSFYCEKCTNINKIQNIKNTHLKNCGYTSNLLCPLNKEKVKQTNLTRYGYEFHLHNEDIKNKRNKTYFEKFGGYPSTNINIKNKIKETNLQKYGVENVFQNNEIKQKIKETNLQKYGVGNIFQSPKFQEKNKQICLEKYGVEYPMQHQETKEKFKQTCLKKYGVEYPNQNVEIMDKNAKKAYKLKIYTFPSGRIDKIQGFENFGLDFLLNNENLNEDEIKTGCKNVPTIWYNDDTGKKHRHYVDIFIPSQNRCIEIKSTWTAQKKQDSIYLKQNAGKVLGYKYEIWVYDRKGNRVEEYL
jgi:hypothetical protein